MISLFFRALCMRGAEKPSPMSDTPPVKADSSTDVAVKVDPAAIWRV
jgi:hypothetical protein